MARVSSSVTEALVVDTDRLQLWQARIRQVRECGRVSPKESAKLAWVLYQLHLSAVTGLSVTEVHLPFVPCAYS